jgi:hypothetical protein
MGGAYSNFALEIHILWLIFKIFKKYHENQHKKTDSNYVCFHFKRNLNFMQRPYCYNPISGNFENRTVDGDF